MKNRILAIAAVLWVAAASRAHAQGSQVTSTPPDYPRGRISGYIFADWYDNVGGDPRHAYDATGVDSGQVSIDGKKNITRDLEGLLLKRVYFQLDNDITARFATRFRLEADSKSLTSDGKLGVSVKAAYVLARNVYPNADLYAGVITTPLIENPETFWGYRSVEKILADFRGLSGSADQGVVLKGYVDPNKMLGYTALVSNGNGQKPENNRQKRYGLALPIRWKDVHLEPYVDYENVFGHQDRATYRVFAGYDTPYHGAVGYELVEQVQHVAGANPTRQLLGHSLYARVSPRPEISAFARVDLWDPNRHTGNKVDQTLWMFGADYQPVKDVHFIPNLEGLQYDAKGTAVAPKHNDLQARITVYYVFSKPQS